MNFRHVEIWIRPSVDVAPFLGDQQLAFFISTLQFTTCKPHEQTHGVVWRLSRWNAWWRMHVKCVVGTSTVVHHSSDQFHFGFRFSGCIQSSQRGYVPSDASSILSYIIIGEIGKDSSCFHRHSVKTWRNRQGSSGWKSRSRQKLSEENLSHYHVADIAENEVVTSWVMH